MTSATSNPPVMDASALEMGLSSLWDDGGWYRLHRAAARDAELGFEAFALLAWCASHDVRRYKITHGGIKARFPEWGKNKIYAAIARLIELGYAERVQMRSGTRFAGERLVIYPVRKAWFAQYLPGAAVQSYPQADAEPDPVDPSYPQDIDGIVPFPGSRETGAITQNKDTEDDVRHVPFPGSREAAVTCDDAAFPQVGPASRLPGSIRENEVPKRDRKDPPPYGGDAGAREADPDLSEEEEETASLKPPAEDAAVTAARNVLRKVTTGPGIVKPVNGQAHELVDLVAARVRQGWTEPDLIKALGTGTLVGVGSVYAVLLKRLSGLPTQPPRKPASEPRRGPNGAPVSPWRVRWCGRCVGPNKRMTVDPDTGFASTTPCPSCHEPA